MAKTKSFRTMIDGREASMLGLSLLAFSGFAHFTAMQLRLRMVLNYLCDWILLNINALYPPQQLAAQLRQNCGENITNTLSNSRRPSNIAIINTHFAAAGSGWKLPAGPIVSPNPGPTFANAVAAPVRLVVRSSPNNARTAATTASVARKIKENATLDATISSLMILPL